MRAERAAQSPGFLVGLANSDEAMSALGTSMSWSWSLFIMAQLLASALKMAAGPYMSPADTRALSTAPSTAIWPLREWACYTAVAMMAAGSSRHALADMDLARTRSRLGWPFCTTRSSR